MQGSLLATGGASLSELHGLIPRQGRGLSAGMRTCSQGNWSRLQPRPTHALGLHTPCLIKCAPMILTPQYFQHPSYMKAAPSMADLASAARVSDRLRHLLWQTFIRSV